MKQCKGFTLVEILVAVSIIGLLSTLGVSGFQAITRSGRDALRKSDLEQIRSALEIYKSQNGNYPDSLTSCEANLSSDYLNTYPRDPKSPTGQYCYVKSNDLQYELCAHIENGDDSDYCGGIGQCGQSGLNCNYHVFNP